jgi:aspartyl-tRNA(Asn)/glutamyl-tRNA(Gln) amidotransferase subunit C
VEPIDVQKLARLAQLKLNPSQAAGLEVQLAQALSYFSQISELWTEGVEPLFSVSHLNEENARQQPRADEIEVIPSEENGFENAPSRKGRLFSVPPVV